MRDVTSVGSYMAGWIPYGGSSVCVWDFYRFIISFSISTWFLPLDLNNQKTNVYIKTGNSVSRVDASEIQHPLFFYTTFLTSVSLNSIPNGLTGFFHHRNMWSFLQTYGRLRFEYVALVSPKSSVFLFIALLEQSTSLLKNMYIYIYTQKCSIHAPL